MKCIENIETGDVFRVSDDEARKLVSQNDRWAYVDKSAWKAQRKTQGPVLLNQLLNRGGA